MHVTAAKSKRRFCSRKCQSDHYKIAYAGQNNPAYGKTYRTKETHPEWAAQIAATSKQSDRMTGDNNPMKRPDVASRMSKTRREQVTSDPAYIEASSKRMLKAWSEGKYDHVTVGKCKWYEHLRPEGVVKLQGTWEVALARWLETKNLTYDAHKGRWTYIDVAGKQRSYYPDFYVHEWEATVDVKGAFWDNEQANKLDFVRASNPDKRLIVANKEWLDLHGVDYALVQRELLKEKQHMTQAYLVQYEGSLFICEKSFPAACPKEDDIKAYTRIEVGEQLTLVDNQTPSPFSGGKMIEFNSTNHGRVYVADDYISKKPNE